MTPPRFTNAKLAEHYARLERMVIELAAKIERMRIDLMSLTARVTVRPPPKGDTKK